METIIGPTNLRCLLADRIPEVRNEFMDLPEDASMFTTLQKLYEVTRILLYQNRFKAVKRCLLTAEELLTEGDKELSNAVCTIYVYYLGKLLDKRDSRAEVVRYLMPRALRMEYCRQLTSSLP